MKALESEEEKGEGEEGEEGEEGVVPQAVVPQAVVPQAVELPVVAPLPLPHVDDAPCLEEDEEEDEEEQVQPTMAQDAGASGQTYNVANTLKIGYKLGIS